MDGDLIHIEVGSLVSARTSEGAVELTVNEQRVQMDLPKAREVVAMLQDAIEAALSDALLFRFLTTRVGLNEEQGARALLDFRELRQGSKQSVRPQ